MKLFIPVHSFVDVITNSSSELFICSTKKSVEAVKETIEALAKLHNEGLEFTEKPDRPITIENLWKDIFSEPVEVKWNFKVHEFPEYSLLCELKCDDYSFGCYNNDPHPLKQMANEAMREWTEENPAPKYPDYTLEKSDKKTYKKQLKAWEAYSKKKDAAENIAFKKYNKAVLDVYKQLYTWAAKVNDIDLTPLGRLVVFGGSYSSVRFENTYGDKRVKGEAADFVEALEDGMAWGYNLNKGDILLQSASDNTVPYEFWPVVENAFGHVVRKHLG